MLPRIVTALGTIEGDSPKKEDKRLVGKEGGKIGGPETDKKGVRARGFEGDVTGRSQN